MEKNGKRVKVSFDVANTGEYDGAETAQIYVGPVNPAVERPVKELKGFEKRFIRKGEKVRMEILLDESAFSYYDVERHCFRCDAGRYRIMVGSSSDSILLEKTVRL